MPTWANFCLAACSVIVGLATAGLGVFEPVPVNAGQPVPGSQLELRDGKLGLTDAGGYFAPAADYRRIVSGSLVSDGLLLELMESDRILAFSPHAHGDGPVAHRYAGKPTSQGLDDVEALLALHPDLVVVNNLGRVDRVQRVRDAGVVVFDLGAMHGLGTFVANAKSLSLLLGVPERGVRLARSFARRMHSVVEETPMGALPGGLYVGIHGDKLYGGTRGTSYSDVLRAAGVRDLAAADYRGWPRYTAEQLLTLDPELLITHSGMDRSLCAHPGMSALRACSRSGRVISIHPALMTNPGLHMLEAAEVIAEQIERTEPQLSLAHP